MKQFMYHQIIIKSNQIMMGRIIGYGTGSPINAMFWELMNVLFFSF
jgi:hypothetical protein